MRILLKIQTAPQFDPDPIGRTACNPVRQDTAFVKVAIRRSPTSIQPFPFTKPDAGRAALPHHTEQGVPPQSHPLYRRFRPRSRSVRSKAGARRLAGRCQAPAPVLELIAVGIGRAPTVTVSTFLFKLPGIVSAVHLRAAVSAAAGIRTVCDWPEMLASMQARSPHRVLPELV